MNKIIKFNEINFSGFTFFIFFAGFWIALSGYFVLLSILCFIISARFYQYGEDKVKWIK